MGLMLGDVMAGCGDRSHWSALFTSLLLDPNQCTIRWILDSRFFFRAPESVTANRLGRPKSVSFLVFLKIRLLFGQPLGILLVRVDAQIAAHPEVAQSAQLSTSDLRGNRRCGLDFLVACL